MGHDEIIRNMIDDILGDRGNDAMEKIHSVMADRVTDALADKKLEIASMIGQTNADVQEPTPAA